LESHKVHCLFLFAFQKELYAFIAESAFSVEKKNGLFG